MIVSEEGNNLLDFHFHKRVAHEVMACSITVQFVQQFQNSIKFTNLKRIYGTLFKILV